MFQETFEKENHQFEEDACRQFFEDLKDLEVTWSYPIPLHT